jgi:hypothetical protein
MDLAEILLVVLVGIALAAGLCWFAVVVALRRRASRRSRRYP